VYVCLAVGVATVCYCSVCLNGNTTCELKPNGQCFTALELDGQEWVMSHGCLAPVDEDGGIILQVCLAYIVCRSKVSMQLFIVAVSFDYYQE